MCQKECLVEAPWTDDDLLWKGSGMQSSCKTLTGETAEGGLKLCDLELNLFSMRRDVLLGRPELGVTGAYIIQVH